MRATVGIVATLGLLALTASLFAQNTATVYSRNAVPGDLYTNPDNFSRGSNFGHPNWRYNNTRGGASVGIRNNYPRNGNGSVYLSSSSGAGKADIEHFGAPVADAFGNFQADPNNPASILGTFGQLTHLSYDWYRAGSSTVNPWFHPVIRVYVVAPDINNPRFGYLTFERAYNQGTNPVPTDQWVSEDIIGSDYKLWAGRTLGFGDPNVNINDVLKPVSEWKQLIGDWLVVSVSAGIGSGWVGEFAGAVDNITFGFNNRFTTYNFEVVPEPASLLALGSGVVGVLALRRRRRA